jgi:hypothetical protein
MALPFYIDSFLEVAVARAFPLDSYQAMLATMAVAPFSEKATFGHILRMMQTISWRK